MTPLRPHMSHLESQALTNIQLRGWSQCGFSVVLLVVNLRQELVICMLALMTTDYHP